MNKKYQSIDKGCDFLGNVIDKRIRRTKLLFHEALLALLQEKEFMSISITDIVRKADVNRGTFYFHYEQKEALLEEMVQIKLSEMIEAFRKPHKSYQTMLIMDISTITLFEHFIKNSVFYKTMLSKYTPINLPDRMIDIMAYHYQQDIDFYLPELNEDLNYSLFFSYRVHGLIGFIVSWIHQGFEQPAEVMAEQLVKIVTLNTREIYIKY